MARANEQCAAGHKGLHVALGRALTVLDRHAARVQLGIRPILDTHLGDIELPQPAIAAAGQLDTLEPIGPFYLAWELELAGLLHTADTIAGLFGSGVIQEPLGAAATLLSDYWHARHQRLTESERLDLFHRVFEEPYFDRMMHSLSAAIAQRGDPVNAGDIRTGVQVEEAAGQLAEYLTERGGGMTAFAAREIVETINDAVRFMSDHQLQAAFGAVGGLWGLVRAGTPASKGGGNSIQAHVDLGSSGQELLRWLAHGSQSSSYRVDPNDPGFATLIANAQRWILAEDSLPADNSSFARAASNAGAAVA